jgi:hypothetical protein
MDKNRFNWRAICIGDFVRLRGKTRHGKNRINQHGDVWEVVDEQLTKILLQSLQNTFKDTPNRVAEKDWRWISSVDDKNFEIVEHLKGEAA